MLLMNLIEEENLNRANLLVDTGFVRFLYIAMFEQVGPITGQIADSACYSTLIHLVPLFRLTISRMVFFIFMFLYGSLRSKF